MNSIVAPMPNQVVVPIQGITPMPEPRCVYTVGGLPLGPLDGAIVVLAGTSFIASVAFHEEGNDLASGCMAGCCVVLCVVEAYLQKYANFIKSVRLFNRSTAAFQEATQQSHEEIERLGRVNYDLSDSNQTLINHAATLHEENQQLEDQIVQITADLQALRQTNEALKTLSDQLRAEEPGSERINNSLKETIREFSAENKTFIGEITKSTQLIPQIEKLNLALQQNVPPFTESLEVHLKALQEEIRTVQKIFQEILGVLQQEKEELALELNSLKSAHESLTQDLKLMSEHEARIQQIHQNDELLTQELRETKEFLASLLPYLTEEEKPQEHEMGTQG